MIGRGGIERQMLDALLREGEAPRRQREGTAAVGRLVDAGARVAASAEVEDVRAARVDEEIGDFEDLWETGSELPCGAGVVAAEDAVRAGGDDDVRISAADDDHGRPVDRA